MNRKRVGLLAVSAAALLLAAVEPAAAQLQYSSVAEERIWDLNFQLIWVAVPITVLVQGILVYTVWKYSKADEAKPTQENRRLEITWTVATAVILLFVGVASYGVMAELYGTASAAEDFEGEEVQVTALKYNWQFEYPDVHAEGVSADGLTLENVNLSNASVQSVSTDGIRITDADVSGPELADATLVNGTVVDPPENRTGTDVSYENVTVEGATIEDGTLADATVSSTGTAVVPTGESVQFNVTSADWLHSFHVPDLGLKQDALPEQSNYIATELTEPGEYQLYCAEYCGSGHSSMLGTVEVRTQENYQEWAVDQWISAQQ